MTSIRMFFMAWGLLIASAGRPARAEQKSDVEALPKGALHRLGTLRYRPADEGATLSPDGKYLAIHRAREIWLLDAATGLRARRFPIDNGSPTSLAFSPGNRMLAVVCSDAIHLTKEVRLFDAATWLPAGRFPIDIDDVTSLAFSPDNRTLAVVYSDSVSFRDIPSGRQLRVCRPPQNAASPRLAALSFSADGKVFAAADFSTKVAAQSSACAWDVATGEAFGPFTGPATSNQAVLSPDGRTLVTWGYNLPRKQGGMPTPAQVVQLWDVAAGTALRRFDVQQGYNSSAAFSPDGKVLAFTGGLGTVHLWAMPAGKELPSLVGRWGLGARLAYSTDGKRLAATAWNGDCQIWNVASGQRLATTRSPANRLVGLAFAGGDRIVAFGVDQVAFVLWDPVTGRVLSPKEGHTYSVDSVSFAADGKCLFSAGSDGKICQWDVVTGKEVRHFYRGAEAGLSRSGHFEPAVLSPDGRYLAADWQPEPAFGEPLDNTGSTHLRLWDLSTGNVTAHIKGFSISYHSGYAFSSDGALLIGPAANGNRGHDLVICAVDTGRQVQKVKIPETEHRGRGSITLSAGGKLAALSYGSQRAGLGWEAWELLLWRTTEAKALCRLRRPGEQQSFVPAFSPSGKVLAAGGLGEILLVDTDTGKSIRTLTSFVGGVSCLAFSPDGRLLAAGVYPRQSGQVPPLDGDCQVHVWDIGAEKTIGRYEGHRRAILSLAFSPDGRLLASASLDTTLLVWELAPRPAGKRNEEK